MPDGSIVEQLGPFVEPVQLQVVCRRLWERLFGSSPVDPAGAPLGSAAVRARSHEITVEDVAAIGDVDRALADYYVDNVRAVSAATGVSERQIRDWVDLHLIVEGGLRGQVLKQPERSQGLATAAIQLLVDAHLVRGEQRRGSTWFELSHDRLVAPIQAENAAWRTANLHPLQIQAALWARQGRPEGLLLRDEVLRSAQQWAALHTPDLTADERAFLDACVAAHDAQARERRFGRLLRRLVVAALLAALLAVGLAVAAVRFALEADRQRSAATQAQDTAQAAAAEAETSEAQAQAAAAQSKTAQALAQAAARHASANELAARSQVSLAEFPQQALLLAVKALNVTQDAGEPPVRAARQALYDALNTAAGQGLPGVSDQATGEARISPDGHWIAAANRDGTVSLWSLTLQGPGPRPRVLQAGTDGPSLLAFDQDGRWLASASSDGRVRLWELAKLDPKAASVELYAPKYGISWGFITFSPDGRWLVASADQEAVYRWDVSSGAQTRLQSNTVSVMSMAISPDSRWLVIASQEGLLRRWELATADPAATVLILDRQLDPPPVALQITPDSQRVVGGATDSTVRIWDLAAADPAAPLLLAGPADELPTRLSCLAISRDGRWLAAGLVKNVILRWDLTALDPSRRPVRLVGHQQGIEDIMFGFDSRVLFSASDDHTLRRWEMDAVGDADVVSSSLELRGHEHPVVRLSTSRDGAWLLSADEVGHLRLWARDNPVPAMPLTVATRAGAVRSLVSIPRSSWFATGGDDLRLYNLAIHPISDSLVVLPGVNHVAELTVDSAGRWLAARGDDDAVWLYRLDVPNPAQTARQVLAPGPTLIGAALSADGRFLAVACAKLCETLPAPLLLWSLTTDQPTPVPVPVLPELGDVTALAISLDGAHVALAGIDGRIWLLSLDSTPASAVPLDPTPSDSSDQAQRVAFSPDGHLLAASFPATTSGAALWIWTLDAVPPRLTRPAGQQQQGRIPDTQSGLLVFSPDNRWLASTFGDQVVRLWKRPDGLSDQPRLLSEHSKAIMGLAFGAQLLATASGDGTARLWSLDPSADPIPVVLRPGAALNALALSPDGRWLLAGRIDGVIELWKLQEAELNELACSTAGRELAADELKRFFSKQDSHPTCPT